MRNKIAIVLAALLLACMQMSAQGTISVSGTVTDRSGLPVIGAGVFVKGTTTGVSTSLDGTFTLEGVPADAVLEASSIGYKSLDVAVNGRTRIDIVLDEESLEIDDAMVVAYGTAKKESFTGSAAVVKGGDLRKRAVGTVTKSLEGSVAGVTVTSGGGQPGEDASVTVRGIGSISAEYKPLYVVDGIPYDGSLSSINPADIESMTVLKDASAGALYGARGANGVIIITTRKGAEERTSISYKGSFGVASRALPPYGLLDTKEFIQMVYESLRNGAQYGTGMDFESASAYAAANLGTQIGGLKNPEYYNPYKNYTWETLIDRNTGLVKDDAVASWDENWMKEISDNRAPRTEHVLSISGGNSRSDFLMTLGYYNEKGVLQNTDFERYTGRINVNTQANDWLKTGLNANLAHTSADYQNFSGSSTSNVWYTAQFMGPVYPVYLKDMDGRDILDSNGNRQYEYGDEDDNGYANRPTAQGFNSKAELFNNKAYYYRNAASARTYLTLGTVDKDALLYGLKFSTNFGVDFNDYQRTVVNDKYHGNAAPQSGRASKTNTRVLSYTFNQILNYERTFASVHDIKLMAGHEFYRYHYDYATGEKTSIMDGIDELAPAVTTSDNTTHSDNYAIESVFTRLNYGFRNRYYFDASWRTDGSSRFHKSHQWGNFWSVGASWRVSEEAFMQKTKDWLSNLTAKLSYGLQGNDNLGTYYAWQGLYEYTWANGTEAGAFASKLENKDVTWEKNANLNTGIDASLFGGRLSVTLEYYNRKTTDMLLSNPLAPSTGFKGFDDNVGSMRNQGFESSFRGTLVDSENFRWDASFTASLNRNKVLELTSSQDQITSGNSVIERGYPIYTFKLSKSAGVDPATGKQLYYCYYRKGVDEKGNMINVRCDEYVTDNVSLASLSKYYMGSREPLFSGSFGMNFTLFKNWDISFLSTYSVGGKVYDSLYSGTMEVQYAGNNWHKDVLRRWQKPGDITDVPMVEIGGSYAATDRYLIDASFFAIKNVTVGYTFPTRLTQKASIKSCRLFFTADNVAMFSRLGGMDPQQNFTGGVSYSYTPAKAMVAGVELNF
ncbi:MAG: TonB-dependent receptor [Bacteroidales bacterium]|nr:TonB-dependent receptor [Bacteroidales bacterium]